MIAEHRSCGEALLFPLHLPQLLLFCLLTSSKPFFLQRFMVSALYPVLVMAAGMQHSQYTCTPMATFSSSGKLRYAQVTDSLVALDVGMTAGDEKLPLQYTVGLVESPNRGTR